MSNAQFAEAIGCHVTTATRYRNGHRLPQVKYLEAIRRLLGLTHDDIHNLWLVGTAWKRDHPKDPERNPFGIYLRKHVFDDSGDEAAA